MCNPRRIVIHATEQMARAWQAELERTVRVNGTVTGEAHVGQSLASLLSPAALRAFERAVGSDPGWILSHGAYVLEIPGGTASYHPDTGELEFTVQLTEELVGSGSGTAVTGGTVTAEASGAAESTYTRRGEWGRSRREAQEEAARLAQDEARRQAEAQAGHLADEARRRALAEAAPELRAEADAVARRNASEDLARRSAARGAELDAAAEAGLTALRQQTMEGVFRTVAHGFKELLLEYADRHGAENLRTDESEQTIEIQFDLEA